MLKVYIFNPAHHSSLLPFFVALHIAVITTDGTCATFIPPLDESKMLTWWCGQAEQVVRGERTILFCVDEDADAPAPPHDQLAGPEGERLAGYVMLHKPATETGPFRGPIEKMLVSPGFRRRGVARMLMARLEEVARAEGRLQLLLDTDTGSPAEKLYESIGFVKFGILPRYGIHPKTGERRDGTYYYKNLDECN